MNHPAIHLISSMATRALLAELAGEAAVVQATAGVGLQVESVGGVEAARRVAEGEPFDLALLADDALATLDAQGCLVPGSRREFVRSAAALAVRAGAPRPALQDAAALRAVFLGSARVGCSTGPSGRHLQALFENLGIAGPMRDRIVQASPGVPVARLLAAGEVDLGFQQRSELQGVPGVQLLDDLPGDCASVTVFSGAVCRSSRQAQAAMAVLEALAGRGAEAARLRHGFSLPDRMAP